jgi:hypothetical protein
MEGGAAWSERERWVVGVEVVEGVEDHQTRGEGGGAGVQGGRR